MEVLKSIIRDSQSPNGKRFEILIIILILYSIVTLTIETLPGLPSGAYRYLHLSDIVVTTLFCAEYVLRVWAAEPKRHYLFSFYGVIDLLAILPTLLGLDLRAVRAFRVFRVVRILKLTRYSVALERIGLALRLAAEEIVLFLLATVIVGYLSAVGIYYFERNAQPEHFKSIVHSLWWAVTTLTTVGYGDVYPVTAGGRVFTFLILMVGLGIVAVPAGVFASALAKVRAGEAGNTRVASSRDAETDSVRESKDS